MKDERTSARASFILHPSAFILVFLFICGSLSAQEVDPQSLYGRESTQSIYVRDSAVAVEKFALAERLERLREWDKAADVYQEILASYADRVVPSQIDKEEKIYQYTSVTPAVHERLARWPEDGLTAYRQRYEAAAAEMLEAAHDNPAQLHRVLSMYFVTDAAKQAAMRLIDLYLEQGEFAAAAWTGQRLLSVHPSLGEQRPRLLHRTAVAAHLAGIDSAAQLSLAELKEKFPAAVGTVRGTDVVLADSLAQHLTAPRPAARSTSDDSWPMAFGDAQRNRIPQTSSFGGARLASIEVPPSTVRNMPLAQKRDFEQRVAQDVTAGFMTGILPVVDRGEMFFQDNARIYALSLDSDQPLPGWAEAYPGERQGRYSISAWPMPRGRQCSVTATDDAVLAVMGQSDLLAMQYSPAYARSDTRLVCLDRRNGKPRWVVLPKQLPPPAQNLRTLDLVGSPLVVGDDVFVQARGNKGAQFEDAYVLAFSLASGQLKWSCYIASANTDVSAWMGGMVGATASGVSQLAAASGRIYAQTNLGALAAIDAYDGSIVWLNLYARDIGTTPPNMGGAPWTRMRRGEGGERQPWNHNPAIVSQGKVFMLPSDGLNVHIYDAGSGVELKRIRLSQFDNCQTLLGVVDEKLVLANERQVFCVDWPKYDPSKQPNDNLVWKSNTFQRAGEPDDSIRGRGCITADSVIVPTTWQLLRLSLRSGAVAESYPLGQSGAWGEDEGPGNVLVLPNRLIIAGPTAAGQMRVNVYTDLALATAKLDAAVAAAPNDATPRLEYARIMFAAGQTAQAVARLDEAVSLLRNDASRAEAFTTALTFATKLARQDEPQDETIIAGLFDRAAATAATAAQKVSYRRSRALFARQHQRPDEEVRLYQEILSDPALAAVHVPDANSEAAAAAVVARGAIDAAIQQHGVEIYAPQEQAAKRMLEAATRAIDPQQLHAVAQTYPNSSAAAAAMLRAAEMHEAAGNWLRATQVLRQLYSGYPERGDRAQVLEALARNYLRLPNHVDSAMARLNRGAGLPGDPKLTRPMLLPDGRQIPAGSSFAQAAEELKQYLSATARDLPDIALPPWPATRTRGQSVEAFQQQDAHSTVANIGMLLVPEPPFVRHDRVVTFTTGAVLQVYAPGSAQPLMTCSAVGQNPSGVAWVGNDLLVWSIGEVMQVAGDSGAVRWRAALKSLPQIETVAQSALWDQQPAEPAADPQEQELVIDGAPGGRVIVRNGQRIVIHPGGQLRIAAQIQAPMPLEPMPADEQIAMVRPATDRVIVGTTSGRIFAVRFDGGEMAWQTRVGGRAATHLLASDDFVVARTADETGMNVQLSALDAASGQMLSRRSFSFADGGSNMAPVNVALAADGMMVYLMPDRIVGQDLFEPGGLMRPTYQTATRPNEAGMPFQNSTEPDHLQIAGDRIIAVADDGASVRVHSLQDGVLRRFNQADAVLRSTGATGGGRTMLRAAGARLYLATPREMRGFDLDRGTSWSIPLAIRGVVNVRDMIVTRGHVVVLTDPLGARRQPNRPAASLQLKAFSRATDAKGDESGVFEHDVDLRDETPIVKWQVVDGGLCYLTADQKLHFLAGGRRDDKVTR